MKITKHFILLSLFSISLFAKEELSQKNYNWSLYGSYTYWSSYQDGMELCFSEGSDSRIGNSIYPNFYTRSGFKVGGSVDTEHDTWKAAINYTWYYNAPSLKQGNLKEGITYESRYILGDITAQSSKFKNQFNRIDGYVSKAFPIEEHFEFTPFAGILGAFEWQYLDMTMTVDGESATSDNKQRWWGVGPYGGMFLNYYVFRQWALSSRIGGSLLLSNHKVSALTRTFDSEGSIDELATNDFSKFNSVEPMVEIYLGLFRRGYWDCFAITLSIGWELQTYFAHNGLRGTTPTCDARGNYSMQGLTATLELGF